MKRLGVHFTFLHTSMAIHNNGTTQISENGDSTLVLMNHFRKFLIFLVTTILYGFPIFLSIVIWNSQICKSLKPCTAMYGKHT